MALVDKQILVVDDEVQNRELLRAYFKKLDQPCILAESGDESIEVMSGRANDIAVILMDVRMRKMSGVDAMKKIKADHDIKVIAVTAFAMDGDKEALMAEGFDNYISKPIDFETLRNLIVDTVKDP